MLSPDRVRELFNYDPATGSLIRRHATKGYDAERIVTRQNDKGYRLTTVEGRTFRVHHLVWVWHGFTLPKELDHKDRDRTNNRIENLRPCTRIQNLSNSGPKGTGYKGVSLCRQTGRWVAQIGYQYRNIKIGRFDTPEEAARAYDLKAKELFGEFAYANNV